MPEVKLAISTELQQIHRRLVAYVYMSAMRSGALDRPLLNWLISNLDAYTGLYEDENTNAKRTLQEFLTYDDAYIMAAGEKVREVKSGRTVSWIRIRTPFLDTQIGRLVIFDRTVQNRLMGIKTRVEIINDDIELARFYFEKTFDSGLSEKNSEIIKANLDQARGEIGKKAQRTADLIAEYLSP